MHNFGNESRFLNYGCNVAGDGNKETSFHSQMAYTQ